MTKCYIKIGDKYFKEFTSTNNGGIGGHSGSPHAYEVKSAILTHERYEVSSISVRGIVGELIYLMRMQDMEKQNISIEVE